MTQRRRLRRPAHFAFRRLARRLNRRLNRPCLKPSRKSGPDDLSQALTAFTQAIRCHRRLAKLAPRFFDAATVNREARDRAERLQRMAIWKPALEKIYGADPDPPSHPETDFIPPLRYSTHCAVNRELDRWDIWMEVGRLAWERHEPRRHAVIKPSRLSSLLRVAIEFGHLASGAPRPAPARFDGS